MWVPHLQRGVVVGWLGGWPWWDSFWKLAPCITGGTHPVVSLPQKVGIPFSCWFNGWILMLVVQVGSIDPLLQLIPGYRRSRVVSVDATWFLLCFGEHPWIKGFMEIQLFGWCFWIRVKLFNNTSQIYNSSCSTSIVELYCLTAWYDDAKLTDIVLDGSKPSACHIQKIPKAAPINQCRMRLQV
jgi:hypothetical protein